MIANYLKQIIAPVFFKKSLNYLKESMSKLNLIFYKTNSLAIRDQIEPRISFLKDILWLFQNSSLKKRKIVKIINEIKDSLTNMIDLPY